MYDYILDPSARNTLSVHQINDPFLPYQKGKEAFPEEAYSKFKYGCAIQARRFGRELADEFVKTRYYIDWKPDGNDIAITASPYKYIAPAASSIKRYFTDRLNEYLIRDGRTTANMLKMSRSVLFEGDYGKLTEEGRTSLLKKDKLTIDRDFVEGKLLLVIDDIKITGAHEEKVARMLVENEVAFKEVVFLYYAELTNPEVVGASYEDRLNHAHVKSLNELFNIIKNGNFILNARVCKYLLSHPDSSEVQRFMDYIGDDFKYDLIAAIHGDGYHTMPTYEKNYRVITKQAAPIKLVTSKV